MTVAADRTVNNLADVARKWPTEALADRVLTSLEGVVLEVLPAGPGIGATVKLSKPAKPGSIPFLVTRTSAGALGAVALPVVTTHFTFSARDTTGVAAITGVVNLSANALAVFYSPDEPNGTIGGQSSLVPGGL